MTDVLFIQPPIPSPSRLYAKDHVMTAPPIALGYLASSIIRRGYDADIIDLEVQDMNVQELREVVIACDPGLLGLSTTTLTYKNALRLASMLREAVPDAKIVLGGSHVTFHDREALENEQVDYVLRGEAEGSIASLADYVLQSHGSLRDIQGLCFRKADGSVQRNPRSNLLDQLDSLPYPARHLLPLHMYSAPGLIITGRGCQGRCIFCAAKGIAGSRYRLRSPSDVVEEVESMRSAFGLNYFYFGDDTFTAVPARTREICSELIRRDLNIHWMCETRVDTVDKETLQAMRDAGCKIVQFGAESGSQKILDSIRKGIKLDNLRRMLDAALEIGLLPTCSFMLPHPRDTWETLEETKDFVSELHGKGVRTAVSVTTPFPGTYLSRHLNSLGLRLINEDTDQYDFSTPVIETTNFDQWDIREIYMDMVLLSLGGCPTIGIEQKSLIAEIE
ncbi:MAG: radical SAM protein [Candidatus Aegiribacteria sp.]|nr:radical SAM protein [Candidatus Aegiribacteria sp.]